MNRVEYEVNEDGCWVVTSHKRRRDGYCKFKRDGKTSYIHRYAYEEAYGNLEKGSTILHTCDEPSCCNPNHLTQRTPTDTLNAKVIKTCTDCGVELSRNPNKGSGYCKQCYPRVRNEKETDVKYNHWLQTGELGIKAGSSVRGALRERLIKHYGSNCDICRIPPEWNGEPLVMILDHIDGNAGNDKEDNLRFVCSNCDSQLDTYKSKNKNSVRVR